MYEERFSEPRKQGLERFNNGDNAGRFFTNERIEQVTDEEGNTILFSIIDYFFYNGEEYAILTDSNDEDATDADAEDEGIACYVMKIVATTDESGEELEEFVPVEDQALEAKLMEIASMKLNSDEEADDED